MSFWNPDTIRAAAGGLWLARPPVSAQSTAGVPADAPLAGVSTDTRSLRPGQVFLALKGEHFDGHTFLRDAVLVGSSLLILSDAGAIPAGGLPRQVGIIKVADTRRALLRLAAAYRKTLEKTRVIAVAGSNGKTTTKVLIQSVLSSRFRGTTSPKSFNNDVGVPLTILSASPSDQYLLCEVGTNAPGEIAALAEVIEPDVAVLTSIGREHLEGLGSLDGVAREEASLLAYLRPGGTAVVTADAPSLAEHLKVVPNLVTFGRSAHADLRLTGVEHVRTPAGDPALRFVVNDRQAYTIGLVGEHNAQNALAALAVGRRFGVTDEQAAAALMSAAPPPMRLQRAVIGGVEILNDAYNANPDSTIAAIQTLAAIGAGARRRVAILGDMLELGAAAPDSHRDVAQAVIDSGTIDQVIYVGHLSLYGADRLSSAGWADDRYTLLSDLDSDQPGMIASRLEPGDCVLLKGSRRMRLERIVEALKARHGPPTEPSPAAAVLRAPASRVPARN
ncbi:MAG: UDP-N-acetylmuramoyl-tripeptide--D-alanyl-D-alanine ligase [Phycisphaeraceae bacterium]|nr:UDP-N-acetylmuramoyl-tripeptide--D-alanyl-D-alanine ligase [Phycisphaeraceae bacterium]